MALFKVNTFHVWNATMDELLTNNTRWAACLLCHSIIVFGDNSQFKCDPATLVKMSWEHREKIVKETSFDHLGPDFTGQKDVDKSVFDGVLFLIKGPYLKERLRAYWRHYGQNFPEDKYPIGPMKLFPDEFERQKIYDKLVDKIKELERENK